MATAGSHLSTPPTFLGMDIMFLACDAKEKKNNICFFLQLAEFDTKDALFMHKRAIFHTLSPRKIGPVDFTFLEVPIQSLRMTPQDIFQICSIAVKKSNFGNNIRKGT